MKKNIVIIIGIFLIVLLLPFFKKTILKGDAKRVQVSELNEHIVKSSTFASGVLKYEEVLLSTESIAKANRVYVTAGSSVKKGDLLISLDSASLFSILKQNEADANSYQALYAKEKVRLKDAEINTSRVERLKINRLVSDLEFEKAKSELHEAALSVDIAKANLDRSNAKIEEVKGLLSKMEIIAPINGIVTSVNVSQGETAIPSTYGGLANAYLMKLADPKSIHAQLYVDEADIAKIEKGQTVNLTAVAYPDKVIPGKISSLSEAAEIVQGRNGKSFLVKVQLDEVSSLMLKGSMSIRGEIFTAPDIKGLAVPVQAIVYDTKKPLSKTQNVSPAASSDNAKTPYIFLVKNGVAVKTRVEVGMADDEFQIISALGLENGQKVIIGPDFDLRHLFDGAPVIIN